MWRFAALAVCTAVAVTACGPSPKKASGFGHSGSTDTAGRPGTSASPGSGPGPDSASGSGDPESPSTATGDPASPAPGNPTPGDPTPGDPSPANPEANLPPDPSKGKPFAKVRLPADFRLTFPTPTGEARAAVQTFRDFWTYWWYAITTNGRDQQYQRLLSRADLLDGGLGIFPEIVAGWRAEGVRPTGHLRVDHLRTTLIEPARIGFAACVDATKLGTRSLSSGEERWTLGKRDTSRYQMRVLMKQTADGWRVAAFTSDYTAKECR
ncbi:hypothetical protein [Nonomuraea sp. NPDC050310]|uniref:hypothetical protein n=1 Tax=Nonomuraea sp. NPDC050310 TaxID=3154935 RepID=UPI0033C999F2